MKLDIKISDKFVLVFIAFVSIDSRFKTIFDDDASTVSKNNNQHSAGKFQI